MDCICTDGIHSNMNGYTTGACTSVIAIVMSLFLFFVGCFEPASDAG